MWILGCLKLYLKSPRILGGMCELMRSVARSLNSIRKEANYGLGDL